MISSDISKPRGLSGRGPLTNPKGYILKTKRFNQIIDAQLDVCQSILKSKAKEYATEDRLHNFRVAADLQGVPAKNALGGMMAKHTVSVYDMCGSKESYSQELWSEKITDSINYLLLLRALIQEEELDKTVDEASRK